MGAHRDPFEGPHCVRVWIAGDETHCTRLSRRRRRTTRLVCSRSSWRRAGFQHCSEGIYSTLETTSSETSFPSRQMVLRRHWSSEADTHLEIRYPNDLTQMRPSLTTLRRVTSRPSHTRQRERIDSAHERFRVQLVFDGAGRVEGLEDERGVFACYAEDGSRTSRVTLLSELVVSPTLPMVDRNPTPRCRWSSHSHPTPNPKL